MYTVASQPSIAAARATPCAWLPALAATTPLARSSSVSRAILVYAPRILNDPGRCRFSHLRYAGPPTSRLSGRDDSIGVYRTTPWSNSAAASISSTLIESDTAPMAPHSADSVSPDIFAIPAYCQPVALIIFECARHRRGFGTRVTGGYNFINASLDDQRGWSRRGWRQRYGTRSVEGVGEVEQEI